MPNKDGTGPEGKGPKTGRQMGNCGDTEVAVEGNQAFCRKRGFGRRLGCGKGFRQNKNA